MPTRRSRKQPSPPASASAPGLTARTDAVLAPLGAPAPPPQQHLPLPRERDEARGGTARPPDDVIRQAQRDIDRALVDTDLRATPGLDAERRKALVQSPETNVQAAEVPVPEDPPPRSGA